MKIFALGLLGLGWFAHSLHSSERSDNTMDWLKRQATTLQSEAASRQINSGALTEAVKSASSQTLAFSPEALPLPPSTEGTTDLSVKEALEWVLEKSQKNLNDARAASGPTSNPTAKSRLTLPNNDPGVSSRPALEQALRTEPGTAAYPLAYALEHGVGGEADYKRAVQLYKLAAENGDARAQSRLGIAYMKGQLGLERNFDRAEKWLTEAAIHEDLSAQYYLGRLLLTDKETDPVDALIWVAVAAKRGYEPAQNIVKEHWPNLTAREQDELVSRVRQWHVGDSSFKVA